MSKYNALLTVALLAGFGLLTTGCATSKTAAPTTRVTQPNQAEVLALITKVNDHWQAEHPAQVRAFWDVTAYQTGNMAAYAVTNNDQYRQYAEDWAVHNKWQGATSDDKGSLEIHVWRNARPRAVWRLAGLLPDVHRPLQTRKEYLPAVQKSWQYLTTTALQPDGTLGYVQPIGEKAIPGQVVDKNSAANFGVGAFLLAASEMYRYLDKN